MEIEEKVELLQQMLLGCDGVYTWCFDSAGGLLHSNCPDEGVLSSAFSAFGSLRQMLEHASQSDQPVFLGTAVGLVWGAAFERRAGALYRAWVLGPVFYSSLSIGQIELGYGAYQNLELSLAWKNRFLEAVRRLPVLASELRSRYLLMLHYCLTGCQLQASDLLPPNVHEIPAPQQAPARDRYQVYAAERALLEMVRTGDLNYQEALSKSTHLSSGVPVRGADPLRKAKSSVMAFCTLVCRAAIEGGLTPEEAYSLGDAYIQSAEDARSLDELMGLTPTLYDDFIRRVHRRRTNPSYSQPVQKCVDYIEMHLTEKVRAADLAKVVGYEEYYITRRFKKETGYSVNDYVKFAKIERAKVLLCSTNQSVQQIAASLGFSTRSYFSQCFRQVAGMTPAAWRVGQWE